MKKLIILLLLIPLVSFGQDYKDEKPALMEKIKSWGDKKAFEIYKDLTINVQDKSTNVSNAMFPDPNDYEKAYDKQLELLEEYKLEFIKKYKKEGMSKNMIIAIDWYGTMKNEWYKNFKNLYNQ
tara:strand:+ start:39 stop:410 length:372 start_codon:yes stop_codon:yes gene_type:complete